MTTKRLIEMSNRQAITIRLTDEQLDNLDKMKKRIGIKVSNKAIAHALTEFVYQNDLLLKANARVKELERENALIKSHAANLLQSIDFFSTLD